MYTNLIASILAQGISEWRI